MIIGHEISHGFDDQGSEYDAQGRLANWWTGDDLKKFREKSACVMRRVRWFNGCLNEMVAIGSRT